MSLQDMSSRRLQDMSSRLLQDMSSRRLEDVFSVTIFRLPRRLQDVLQEVFKTSSKRLCKTSSRRLGRRKIVTLKTCWRPTNFCWDYSVKSFNFSMQCRLHTLSFCLWHAKKDILYAWIVHCWILYRELAQPKNVL